MTISSQLESANDRFLSICIQGALADAWLSSADLVAEFPPSVVMEALEGAQELRSKVLVEAAGVHERIAPKKSTSAAAEDLQIALDEGICTSDQLLELFGVDDRVRYLDKDAQWSQLIRDEFWLQDNDNARARMLATLQAGLDQGLIDLPRLVKAVTPEALAEFLPQEILQCMVIEAIKSGLSGSAFNPQLLLETVPLEDWVLHVPLVHLWDNVVLAEIASSAGLAEPAEGDAIMVDDATFVEEEESPKPTKGNGQAQSKAKPASQKNEVAAPKRTKEEEAARQRAVDNLKAIDRLPKNVEQLSNPLLLAIDAMYAELLSLGSDEERAECIRDAFPNPTMLQEALFSLAETLDPRLNPDELRGREASVDSLIQLVLFEERRRISRARASVPPPVAGAKSVPPPLPPGGTPGSVPPPPLPPGAKG